MSERRSRRYDVEPDSEGWTVLDVFTGLPVVVNGVPQVGMAFWDAEDLSELLDHPALKGKPLWL